MTQGGPGDGSPFLWSLSPEGDKPEAPSVSPETETDPDTGAPSPPAARRRRALLAVLGGLIVLIVLLVLFLIGTKLPGLAGAAATSTLTASPAATSTPATSATPTPTSAPVGPAAIGVHPWDALRGGECLDPYSGPWAETFTVVDCASPHPAQLVFRGTFAETADAAYPGEAALQSQISLLCTAPGVLDLAAAGQYGDAQLQGAYAVTAAEWEAGEHDCFCFLSRSSGQSMTGSVARAGA